MNSTGIVAECAAVTRSITHPCFQQIIALSSSATESHTGAVESNVERLWSSAASDVLTMVCLVASRSRSLMNADTRGRVLRSVNA